jgi:hypothetical protein
MRLLAYTQSIHIISSISLIVLFRSNTQNIWHIGILLKNKFNHQKYFLDE